METTRENISDKKKQAGKEQRRQPLPAGRGPGCSHPQGFAEGSASPSRCFF